MRCVVAALALICATSLEAELTVTVTSNEAALVYVDGFFQGAAPVTLRLEPGLHKLKVQRSYRLTSRVFTLESSAQAERERSIDVYFADRRPPACGARAVAFPGHRRRGGLPHPRVKVPTVFGGKRPPWHDLRPNTGFNLYEAIGLAPKDED